MSTILVIAIFTTLLVSPALARSRAADHLVREQVAGACETGRGTIDGDAFIERDLTGDGEANVIISHDGITCSDGGRSNACGMQVCSMMVYVREGALLKLAVDNLLGTMVTVGTGKVPAIRWRGHGGGARSMKWNGRDFG